MGKGVLPNITYSSDRTIIVLSDGYNTHLLRASDDSEITSIHLADDGYGEAGPISPDNRLIITQENYGYGNFHVIDIHSKETITTVTGFGGTMGMIFTPDGQHVAFLNGDQTTGGPYYDICLLDIYSPTNSQNDNINCYPVLNEERYHTVTTPAVSPDGRWVAAGYRDSTNEVLYVWNTESKAIHLELKGQASEITSVNFSPDCTQLASSGEDGMVKLWDPITGELKRVITGFTDHVEKVKFTPDGRGLIVSVINQPDVYLDLASGKITPVATPTPDPLTVKMIQEGYLLAGSGSRVLFSPDGKWVAVGHGSIQIWDVNSGKLVNALSTDRALSITGMVFSPDSNHLAVVTDHGNIYLWNTITGKEELSIAISSLSSPEVFAAYGSSEIGLAIRNVSMI